ncbi:MAG TPA: RagB/SusD family nutrient uptake outer membrane protein [Puia sp.]|nr:RagB/SusD family nutrient uptake outer membrane protein [Puia sp.]
MLKKIAALLVPVILLGAGCSKDPSAVAPTNEYALTNYPATIDGLNSVLATAYSAMRDANMYGFNYLPKAMASITHTADDNGYDAGWQEMLQTNLSATNTYSLGVWEVCYAGIKNCNTTLQAANEYMASYAQPGDGPTVDLIRGQAYCLRGYYYLLLESLFGEDFIPNPSATDTLGIIIDTTLPTSLAASQKPRSSIKASWAQVVSDLTQAATLLHGQVWTGNDKGRASEWAADGLLGKAYVYMQDWTDARTTLLNVISNSGKSLMPYAMYRDAFVGISANEFNQESLLELNIDYNSFGDYGVYGGAPNSTSINGLIWSPWVLGTDGSEGDAQALGYGNETIHDRNILRFGYTLGAYTLVANPNFDAAEQPSPTNPRMIMDPTYYQNAMAVRTNQTADPRLYVNCMQPWLDSAVNAPAAGWVPGTVPVAGYIPVSKPAGTSSATQLDWSFRKYAPIFCNVNDVPGGQADGANIYILRLADVYLLYAEACINTNDNTDGLEYLNMVKRRAYGYPVNSPSPVDYASVTSATPAAAAGDPVLGNNPLYYERWAELFNEGTWWTDICRWHLGASEAAYYQTYNLGANPLTFNPRCYAWPIPVMEINANSKVADEQNPGY